PPNKSDPKIAVLFVLFSVLAANHQLQSRPGLIDRADFYIHESERQCNLPNHVLSHISRNSRRFFRPRNPNRSVLRYFVAQDRQFLLQFAPVAREEMDKVRTRLQTIG